MQRKSNNNNLQLRSTAKYRIDRQRLLAACLLFQFSASERRFRSAFENFLRPHSFRSILGNGEQFHKRIVEKTRSSRLVQERTFSSMVNANGCSIVQRGQRFSPRWKMRFSFLFSLSPSLFVFRAFGCKEGTFDWHENSFECYSTLRCSLRWNQLRRWRSFPLFVPMRRVLFWSRREKNENVRNQGKCFPRLLCSATSFQPAPCFVYLCTYFQLSVGSNWDVLSKKSLSTSERERKRENRREVLLVQRVSVTYKNTLRFESVFIVDHSQIETARCRLSPFADSRFRYYSSFAKSFSPSYLAFTVNTNTQQSPIWVCTRVHREVSWNSIIRCSPISTWWCLSASDF